MGRFVIVSTRRASDVANAINVKPDKDIVGNWINFHAQGLEAEGLGCDSWTISKVESVANLDDPILADAVLAPGDGPNSSGDARQLISFQYTCEGERILSLTKIDDRVVVIPWDNSVTYLLAEIPLSDAEITRLQKVLRSMKLYEGAINSRMDEATTTALSAWVSSRADSEGAIRFLRPVITRNLLDGFDVLKVD